MSRPVFYVLSFLVFAVASLAVGIRGADSWALYELATYYFFVSVIVQEAYERITRADTERA